MGVEDYGEEGGGWFVCCLAVVVRAIQVVHVGGCGVKIRRNS